MKVLITGAAGQLGRCLQDTAPPGADLVATTSKEFDLADVAGIVPRLRQISPDLIMNAAAYTAVDKAESDAERAMLVNGTAVGELARYAEQADARLVHVSTDFVFDGSAHAPWAPDAPTNPLGVYGRTKLAGELAARKHRDAARIVRTSWVHSEYGNNFVKTMLRLGASRDELTVVADQTGTPTYARNLAAFLWRFADLWPEHPVLHFSDAGAITWHGFAEAIFEEAQAAGMLGKAPTVHKTTAAEYGAPAPRPAYSVLDTTLAETAFGIETQDWRSALSDMLARLAQQTDD